MASNNPGLEVARALLVPRDNADLQMVIDHADKWRPQPTNGSFRSEMEARTNHLNCSMQADMATVLKRRFKQRWNEIEKEQVNLPVFAAQVGNKAKTFADTGELYLVGDDGERLEDQEAFDDMVKRGQFWTALKDADLYTQGLNRSCVELEWDPRRQCVVPNVWGQHLVHAIPHDERYWSLDDAYAVAFEMPGLDGWGGQERRYKVWVKVPDTIGAIEGAVAQNGYYHAHYGVGFRRVDNPDGKEPEVVWFNNAFQGNPDKVIPFVDEEHDGEPLFPFVWWQDDLMRSLYWIGDEDALTIPRMLNSALTDINFANHFLAIPPGYWKPTHGDVTGSPPAMSVFSPGDMAEGGEWEPAFAQTGWDPTQTNDFWTHVLKQHSAMTGNAPMAMIAEGGAAESGYALKIRNLPLTEHRGNMIEIMRPMVIETLRRAIVVHNTYCGEAGLTVITGRPMWEPGDIEPPIDEEATARVWQLKITKNISTPVDWRMAETGEDRETAEAAVKANAELNKELAEAGIAGSLMGARAAAFGAPPAPEQNPEQNDNSVQDNEEDDD